MLKEEKFFSDLNEEQKNAVFSKEERICVVAGPGCGKTKTLISRIYRVLKEEKNGDILVLTFGKKAINEIKTRVFTFLNNVPEKRLKISNIHSFCYEFLQKHHKLLDSKSNDKNFFICDSDLQKNFVKEAINRADEIDLDDRNIFQIIKDISFKKINVLNKLEKTVEKIYFEYEKILKEENCFDFSDLLIYTLSLLENNQKLRDLYQKKYSHILVDEFQDINEIQWGIIKRLKKEQGDNSLFVVGDPNQCVYGFQGSAPQIIKSFINDSKNWKTYYLNTNYRSSGNIVKFSNNFLVKNKESLVQNFLNSTKKEGFLIKYKTIFFTQGIVEIIEKLSKNYTIDEIAVIYRSNYLSAWLEKDLIKKGIPYEILGAYKFLNRSEVKDIVSYLRSIISLENSSFLRVMSLVQGIGKKTIDSIEAESRISNLKIVDFLSEQILLLEKNSENFFSSKIKSLKKIRIIKDFFYSFNLIKEKFESDENLSSCLRYILDSFGYINYISERFGEEKLMNIDQFINITKKWEEENSQSLAEIKLKEKTEIFLNYLFLSFSDEEQIDEKTKVRRLIISNIHQVKGLEFKVVLFAYLEKGIIPSSMSNNSDEEKRIFYVGITRPKELLYLISSGNPSLFLAKVENLPYVEID